MKGVIGFCRATYVIDLQGEAKNRAEADRLLGAIEDVEIMSIDVYLKEVQWD